MRVSLAAFIFSLWLPGLAYTADLIDVYQLSVESNPTLRAEAAAREAVGELDDQARAAFLPEINLSAGTARVWEDTSSQRFAGEAEFNDHGYTLNLVQPLYRRENFIQRRQADIAIEGAEAQYRFAEQALVVRVAERYFDVLGRQDDLRFAEAEQQAIARQLEEAQQRLDVGLATITDITEAEAAADLAEAEVIAAENALVNSREQLRETTGKYVDKLAGLTADVSLPTPQPADVNAWSEQAITQNPSLEVAGANVGTAREEIEIQRSGHYPTLDLVAQKDFSSQSDSNLSGTSKTHTELVGVEVNLPIFSGGVVSSRTREAGFRLDQAMENEEQQRRAVMRQAREAYNSVIAGISRVKALQRAVTSNQKALEATEVGFEVGTRTTVDVLNARRELFRARRDYTNARYDYLVNTLRLKQAAGIVGAEDLSQINDWLESS